MRIGFYLDVADPALLSMARVAIASARRVMPAAEIIHLTMPGGPRLEEADTQLIVPAQGSAWARRPLVQGCARSPILLVDIDVVFRKSVAELWDLGADLALPVVEDPFVRYTGGVVYSADPDFWHGWAAEISGWAEPIDIRDMLVAFGLYVDDYAARRNVVRLPHSIYECLPLTAEDDCAGAAIVHYRGPRKRWFPMAA